MPNKILSLLISAASLLVAATVLPHRGWAADGTSARAFPPAQAPWGPFQPKLPAIPRHRFSIQEFGAVGDGATPATGAIQAAIDAARNAGGGTVEVPAGDFVSGPIRMASHIDLHIAAGATLHMLPLDKYPGGTRDPENFISGSDLHDVAISGSGTIDGNGEPWWPYARVKGANRPRMIAMHGCERVLIEGVTLRNSPMFHIAIGGHAQEVTVRGVTIRAPASTAPVNPSHNTDACDVSGNDILVQNCDVSVGDDNFTCGGGTSNVLITHCTYGEGHGVSIGSGTSGGVTNFAVVDCTFRHTDCGIRIKSDRGRGGLVHHVYYDNLRMTDVGFPILIYGSYMAQGREYRDLKKLTPEIAAQYPSQAMGPRTPVFRDIIFRNITATAQRGCRAGLIWGLPEAPAANIRLENVNITADLPFGVFSARGIQFINSTITTPEGINQIARANAEVTVSPR